MKKRIVLIFLGDFFYDGRCINMANTIIDAGHKLHVIDIGKSKNKFRGINIFHVKIKKMVFLDMLIFILNQKN